MEIEILVFCILGKCLIVSYSLVINFGFKNYKIFCNVGIDL